MQTNKMPRFAVVDKKMLYCAKCETVSKSSVCGRCIEIQFKAFSPTIGKLELLDELPAVPNRSDRIRLQSQGELYVAELFHTRDDELGKVLLALKDVRNLETAVMGVDLNINGEHKHAVLYRAITTTPIENAHPARLLEACAQLFKVIAKIETLGYSHHGLSPSDVHFTVKGATLGSSSLFTPLGTKVSRAVNARYYTMQKQRTNTASPGDDAFALSLSIAEILNGKPIEFNHGIKVSSGDFRSYVLDQIKPSVSAHIPVFDVLRRAINGTPAAEIALQFRSMCRNSVWSDVRIERRVNDREYEGYDLIGGRKVLVQMFGSDYELRRVQKTARLLSHALPCVYRSYPATHTDATALVMERIEGASATDVQIDTAMLDALHLEHEKMPAKLVDGQLRFSRIVLRM